jgi:ribosome-binding factor A
VGKGIGIRLTPTLEFIPDALPEGAAHLEGLLQTAKQRDAEVAAARAGATYAGDPDPYKKPAADEEDPTDDDAAVDVAPAGDDPSTGDHHATDDHSTDDHPTTDDDHS